MRGISAGSRRALADVIQSVHERLSGAVCQVDLGFIATGQIAKFVATGLPARPAPTDSVGAVGIVIDAQRLNEGDEHIALGIGGPGEGAGVLHHGSVLQLELQGLDVGIPLIKIKHAVDDNGGSLVSEQ